MKINQKIWKQVILILTDSKEIPFWLSELLRNPLSEVLKMPDLEDVCDGEVASPFIERKKISADYLDFLVRQIESGDRVPDWTVLLKKRFHALHPYLNSDVINITFYRKPDSVTVRLDAETYKLVQIEVI